MYLCGVLSSSTNLELFELYGIVELLYSGGHKPRVTLLDRFRLCQNGLESPLKMRHICVSTKKVNFFFMFNCNYCICNILHKQF